MKKKKTITQLKRGIYHYLPFLAGSAFHEVTIGCTTAAHHFDNGNVPPSWICETLHLLPVEEKMLCN